jgi:hypothetical protein
MASPGHKNQYLPPELLSLLSENKKQELEEAYQFLRPVPERNLPQVDTPSDIDQVRKVWAHVVISSTATQLFLRWFKDNPEEATQANRQSLEKWVKFLYKVNPSRPKKQN